jgi:hypothetical protein
LPAFAAAAACTFAAVQRRGRGVGHVDCDDDDDDGTGVLRMTTRDGRWGRAAGADDGRASIARAPP